VVISLRDGAGDCTPTDFDIAAGATLPAGTYSSDCAVAFDCIEGDQQITATGVVGGQRSLEIVGLIGDGPCYETNVGFTMPGNDETEDLGSVVLAPDLDACPIFLDAGVSDAAIDGGV
jgi:hypothetical protein